MAKRNSRPADAADRLTTTVAALQPDRQNRRKHMSRNLTMIGDALREVGAGRSIVIDETGEVLAGNGVLQAAAGVGFTKVQIVDAPGDTIVAVRRSGLTAAQKRALAIYDNRTAELAEWDLPQLQADADAGLDLKPFWTAEEEAALLSTGAAAEVERLALEDHGDAEPRAAVTTGDFQTFSCPLTVDQERIVRGALRAARRVYQVTTAGDALTAALQAWTTTTAAAE